MKLKEFVFEKENGCIVRVSFENGSPEDMLDVLKMLQEPKSTTTQDKSPTTQVSTDFETDIESMTIREKLNYVVQQIKYGWFTSDHIRELYQFHFNEDIKPSTVSTYLSRMFEESVLERRGSRARREYRLAENEVSSIKTPIKYI